MATVNDVLRATLKGVTIDSETYNMVFNYIVTAGTESDYEAIATAIETALESAFVEIEARLSNEVITTELELAEWDFTNNEWDGKATVTANSLNGAIATDAEPGGVAIVLRFITESLRRQGRKFIPGLVEADVSGNTISAATLVDAAAAATDLNNDITAGGVTLTPCTFNDTPLSPHFETASKFIQTSFVNSFVGYQRRRQPGDGI